MAALHDDTLAAIQQVRDNASQMTYHGEMRFSVTVTEVIGYHLDAVEKVVKLHREYIRRSEPNLGLEE